MCGGFTWLFGRAHSYATWLKEVYNLSGGYVPWELVTDKQSNEDIFDNINIGKDDHLYQFDKTQTSILH